MIGTLLDRRYRIDALLGEGGMGVVYRAHDLTLQRDVAVKLVRAEALDDEGRVRLLREARAAAALNHPGIVAAYDAGDTPNGPYVVMELFPGADLRHLTAPTLSETLDIARQLATALAHAHENGVVHRDLKPENVLARREGGAIHVKIADLGLAISPRLSRLTQTDALVGTAWYLPPEQALGREPDARGDLYSLGVVLYELVAGRLPFTGEDALTVVSQHLYSPVVPPRTYRADLPPGLESVILRLLAKQPEDRPADAATLLGELEGILPAADAEAPGESASDGVRLLDLLARGRLVGRAAELRRLRELWSRAIQGSGHLVLLSGEPGAGKTRLAREAQVMARLSGADVLSGGCYEFEATTPYLPFVEALRRWVGEQSAETLRDALGDTVAGLARLAPEIASKLGTLPAEAPLAAGEERLRLFDQVARWLRTLAQRRGVLLLLDDLHWADHGTLALLHYLLRQTTDQRLLVLGCYRETELARTHPLAAALVDWNRDRLATRVPLGRLDRDSTGQLLAYLFGQQSASTDFVDAIHRETDGNPFFIEEVIKSLIEQGQIYRGDGAWQRHAVHELAIPQSIKAAVSRRLDRLDEACTEVLHCAAALGKVFAYDELAATCTIGEDGLLDALDAAAAAQLVRSEGPDSFAFTHDKIREVLHDELNPIRRRRTHLRIGETLEKLHANDPDDHVGDLAYHFIEAGELKRGLDYARRAASAAGKVHAHEEAVNWYERARECAEGLEDTVALREIFERMGRSLLDRGRLIDSIHAYESAIALAETPRQRGALRAAMGLAMAHASDPRGPEVMAQALVELDPATQATERALALTMIGRFHHYRMEHLRALEYYAEARTIAESAGDVDALDVAISFTAGAYQHLADFVESDGWARRGIELGMRHGHLSAEANGYEFLAENASVRGDWDDSIRWAERDLELGRRSGSLSRQAWARFSLGRGLFGLGRLHDALASARESEAIAGRLGETRLQVLLLGSAVRTMVQLGLFDEAAAEGDRAMEMATRIGQPWIESFAVETVSQLEYERGDVASACARLERIYGVTSASDNRLGDQFTGMGLAECYVSLGRLDEARALLDRVLATTRRSGSHVPWARGRAAEGRLLAARGEHAAARAAFDEAADSLERSRTPIALAGVLIARAALGRDGGDLAGARTDLERARDLAASCDAEPVMLRATRALEALGPA